MKLPKGFKKGTDGHCHPGLDEKDYPRDFAGRASKWLLENSKKTRKRSRYFAKTLKFLIFWSHNDALERLENLVDQSWKTTTQRLNDMFKYCKRVVYLTVDLEYMNAGPTKRTFEDQLKEGIVMKELYPGRILLYMCIDPKRPNIRELVEKYHEHVDGWKYYAPVAGSIDNPTMYWLLAKYPKPVIMHTTNTSPVYDRKIKKCIAVNYANPTKALPLINKFPNVLFIFAHAGGLDWFKKCLYYTKIYKNIKIDVSYFGIEHIRLVEDANITVPGKVNWGTDCNMIEPDEFLTLPFYAEMQASNDDSFGVIEEKLLT